MSEYDFEDNNTSLVYNRTDYDYSQKEKSLVGYENSNLPSDTDS